MQTHAFSQPCSHLLITPQLLTPTHITPTHTQRDPLTDPQTHTQTQTNKHTHTHTSTHRHSHTEMDRERQNSNTKPHRESERDTTHKQTGIPRHSQTKVYSRSRSHPEISTRPQVDSRIWFNPHSHATPTTRNTTHLTSLRYTVPHYPHYVNWLLLLNNEFSDFQLSTFHVYKYLHA